MKRLFKSVLLGLSACLFFHVNAQDGSLDPTFLIPNITGMVRTTAVQSDQKILVAGRYVLNDYNLDHVILSRLNTDGTFDETFNIARDLSDRYGIADIALQKDGKILIAGEFINYNDKTLNRLARLHPDGSLDTSFQIGTGADNNILSMELQEDGKIVIAGGFHSYNGVKRNNLARVNANGSLDTTFKIGTGATTFDWDFGTIRTCLIQKNGKILIGGHFITYNGRTRNHIASLNEDGSIDETFKLGFGADEYVEASALQKDGKILIVGKFRRYSNIPISYVARLNTDGTLDSTFTVDIGADEEIYTVAIQHDGKILVGGVYHEYDGLEKYKFLTRLHTDGHLDPTFFRDTLTSNGVGSITVQADGKIITAGGGDVFRLGKSIVTAIDQEDNLQENKVSVAPNPNTGDFTIHFPKEGNWRLINSLGQTFQIIHLYEGNNYSVSISGLEKGLYILRNDASPKENYKVLVSK